MRQAQIVGYGQTRFGVLEDATLADLGEDAARAAMAGAGIDGNDVEALFLGTFAGNSLGGQGFGAAVVAERLGLGLAPAAAFEGACASGGLAMLHAVRAVRAGVHDVVLVVGTEKMTGHPTADVTDALARAADTSAASARAGLTFPGFFALVAQRYLHEYDVDRDMLAHVSVKNREHGSHNPKAHFQRAIELDTAISARPIADPLRLYDCSPISDGGAAVVVASSEWAAAHGCERPVDVLAVTQAGGPVAPERMESFLGLPAAAAAAEAALTESGITRDELDVAEVHDCFSIAEWVALEDIGLFERGEAAAATADGATRVGGAMPVNPSGGLLSKGHPVGATGVAQVIEIARQVRGEADNQVAGAEVGLSHNVGGTGGVAVVTVLRSAA